MKSEFEIRRDVQRLRQHLTVEFGDKTNISEAVRVSIKAKIESKLLEAIDTMVSSYHPQELGMFIKAWHDEELKRL